MFQKVLIANRGEIALRILRALKRLDCAVVVAYAEEDRETLAVQMADQAVCIGDHRSYLMPDRLISAALVTGAEAIHPGYGFLSENAAFFEKALDKQIVMIGPDPQTMIRLGDKAEARRLAVEAGVPVIGGSEGPLADVKEAMTIADELGYPVLFKAVSGGGGRGMRVVNRREELTAAYQTASAEAKAAFGDDRLYLEMYLERPKHLEVQVLADHHGNVVVFPERDCSMQRRHQKIVEESPGATVAPALSEALGKSAEDLCRLTGYRGAGTVEFLVDGQGRYFFIEMNTRIQVEHTVTEMLTSNDLVALQIRIAAGEPLPTVSASAGHVIECRVNAEDPSEGFRPSPGQVRLFHVPGGPGTRWDSHLYDGYKVPPYFDALIGKLIVHGATRQEAIGAMRHALDELLIEGIKTNVSYLKELMRDTAFLDGTYHTKTLEEK